MTTRLASDAEDKLACSHSNEGNCRSCRLADLCIPISLNMEDISKLEMIVSRGRPIDRGEHIYRESDHFDTIYAVRLGCIKTYKLTGDGREQVTGFYLPGEVFGVDGVASSQHSNSAIALDTSAICAIPFERLSELSSDIPSLQRHLFQLMGKEISEDRKLITMLSKNSAEERIAALFLSLSKRYSERGLSATRIRLPMSRGEMGNYLGLTVETISRVLSKLQKQSILSIDNKEVEILDIDGLRAQSNKDNL